MMASWEGETVLGWKMLADSNANIPMPLNSTVKNGLNRKFWVMCVLLQEKCMCACVHAFLYVSWLLYGLPQADWPWKLGASYCLCLHLGVGLLGLLLSTSGFLQSCRD